MIFSFVNTSVERVLEVEPHNEVLECSAEVVVEVAAEIRVLEELNGLTVVLVDLVVVVFDEVVD